MGSLFSREIGTRGDFKGDSSEIGSSSRTVFAFLGKVGINDNEFPIFLWHVPVTHKALGYHKGITLFEFEDLPVVGGEYQATLQYLYEFVVRKTINTDFTGLGLIDSDENLPGMEVMHTKWLGSSISRYFLIILGRITQAKPPPLKIAFCNGNRGVFVGIGNRLLTQHGIY